MRLTEISRSADHGAPEGFLTNDACETKVTELDLRELCVRREEHVLRLQVAVDNVLAVKMLESH